jgi:hypothetical protein
MRKESTSLHIAASCSYFSLVAINPVTAAARMWQFRKMTSEMLGFGNNKKKPERREE